LNKRYFTQSYMINSALESAMAYAIWLIIGTILSKVFGASKLHSMRPQHYGLALGILDKGSCAGSGNKSKMFEKPVKLKYEK